MDWKGFSHEEIENLKKRDIHKSTKDNSHVTKKALNIDVKTSKILPSVSSNKPCSIKGYKRIHDKETDKVIGQYHQISPNAKLSNKEDTISSDVEALNHEVECNDNKTDLPVKKKLVTIAFSEDKTYEVLPSVSNNNDVETSIGLGSEQDCSNTVISNQNGHLHSSLELFQERQKQMEEQNRRRRELLSKAIADRKRQTQFEAKKILHIQEELNRLDALLSTDVEILRNQIEVASSEFNDAQKRYDHAENEFIQAKLHLFNKLERKELLTEHLCRIIEVNEQRKAKKLSELMAKLEIPEDSSLHEGIQEIKPEILLVNCGPDGSSSSVRTAAKDPKEIAHKIDLNESPSLPSNKLEAVMNNSSKTESLQNSVPNLIRNNLCAKETGEDQTSHL